MDQIAYFKRWPALEVRQYRANTEKMALGGRDLHSGNDQEIVDRQTIRPHISPIHQILYGIAGVVVGDGEAVEAFGSGRFDQLLWAADTVARKERVAMQVDLDGHEASLSKLEKHRCKR
jgi:hypothetical protein